MASSCNSSEFWIVLHIFCFRLSNKSLNESRLSFHPFKNVYDLFPNQTWIFRFIWLSNSITYRKFTNFLCNEPILSSIFKVKSIINIRPEYSEDSFDQTNICQQSCFFIQIQRLIFNLYIGHPSITHCTKGRFKFTRFSFLDVNRIQDILSTWVFYIEKKSKNFIETVSFLY